MTDDQSQLDPALLDLFRSDVAVHTAALEFNLMSLQTDPSMVECLDALAEAAYAIKGTAQIVGLDRVAEFAIAMQECFGTARKESFPLQIEEIDILLKGVGLLTAICGASDEAVADWEALNREKIDEVYGCIEKIKSESRGRANQCAPPSEALIEEEPLEAEAEVRFEAEDQAASQSSMAAMIDPIMLDIFRSEVAGNAQILNEGLLLLESEPGGAISETLDSLMRAAHSIKGAGRIVDLDPIVKVAHAMEDCFVAARRGEISLGARHVDVLLGAVDTLVRISTGAAGQGKKFMQQIDALVDAVRAICTGAPPPREPSPREPSPRESSPRESSPREPAAREPSPPEAAAEESLPKAAADEVRVPEIEAAPRSEAKQAPASAQPAVGRGSAKERPADPKPSEPPAKGPAGKGRMMRVSAKKIERLIGLAGEVAVNTRWLPLFSDSLLALKKDQMELSAILEHIEDALQNGSEKASELVYRARQKAKACNLFLVDRVNRLNTFISNTTSLSERHYQQAVGVRMRPFADGSDVRGLPRMVRDLARDLGKKVRLEVVGRATEVDRDILERLDAPLNHLLRNSVDHGIESPEERRAAGKPESGTIRLHVEHRSGMLMIRISDDGRGIDFERLKQKILKKGLASGELVERLSETELLDFLFLPGFSTAEKVTEISGRGVGLDVVHSMVHEVGGIVRAFSKQGEGITFIMELPLTLSVVRTLLVEIAKESYAFPLARIDRCLLISNEDIQRVEERQYFQYGGRNIALVNIHRVLEIAEAPERNAVFPVVVVSDRTDAYGLVVDNFLGECDLVVRPLDPRLGKVANYSAAALLLDGTPVLIFDVDDLVCSINNQLGGKRLSSVSATDAKDAEKVQKRILVVDDSITVRELERKMLEHKGYRVDVAVDGMDGWNAIRSGHYDLIISDVDMPRMNGIEMVTQIRQHPDMKTLPIIIISYKDKEDDKLAGLQAGANYYLTKSSFQDRSFVDAVVDLIGEAHDTDRDS